TADGEVAVVQQGQGGQGGFGGPQVSDDDLKKVDAVLKAHPKEKKQLDDLRAKMMALRPAGFGGGAGGPGGGGGGNRTAGGRDTTQRRPRGGNASGGADTSGGARRGRGGSPEMQALNEQIRAIYTTLNLDPRTAGSCARRQQGGNAGQTGGGAARVAGGTPRQGGSLTPSPEMGGRPQRNRQGLVFVSD